LYRVAEEKQADVVSSGYRRPDSTGANRMHVQPKASYYSRYLIMAAWSKLHRTQFVQENGIEFLDNQVGEDLVFTLKEITLAKVWETLDYTGYNWFYNEKSVSNTTQKGLTETDKLLVLLEQLHEVRRKETYDAIFVYFMFRTAIFYLLFSGRTATPNRFIEVYDELFDFLTVSFMKTKKSKIYIPKEEQFKTKLIVKIFISLRKFHLMGLFARLYCRGDL
jgi:hypothetical protein